MTHFIFYAVLVAIIILVTNIAKQIYKENLKVNDDLLDEKKTNYENRKTIYQLRVKNDRTSNKLESAILSNEKHKHHLKELTDYIVEMEKEAEVADQLNEDLSTKIEKEKVRKRKMVTHIKQLTDDLEKVKKQRDIFENVLNRVHPKGLCVEFTRSNESGKSKIFVAYNHYAIEKARKEAKHYEPSGSVMGT